MKKHLLVYQSLYTVTLLTLHQPSQFDSPRLMTSDATREEGTCSLGVDFWVCIRGRGSSGIDGNDIGQKWLSCRDPVNAKEQLVLDLFGLLS